MPPIADLSFHNTVLSNSGLPNKPIKDKSHNYTNRFVQFLSTLKDEIIIKYLILSISISRHSLPESPPDSEPPYSPADGVGQSPRKTFYKTLRINIHVD